MQKQSRTNRQDKAKKTVDSNRTKDYLTTVTILEHIPDAIFILSPNGKIEYANKIAIQLLQSNGIKLIGQNLSKFMAMDFDIDRINSMDYPDSLVSTIYKGVFNEVETAFANGNRIIPVIISFGVVKNNNGKVDYIIASAKDITIREQLKKELRQQELLNISFYHFKELGDLAVNMVHNLSQPITSIQLLAEYMQRQIRKSNSDMSKFEENLQKMSKLLNIVNTSISNLRNVAYASGDDSFKSINIGNSIELVEKQISYELVEKNITFEKKYNPLLPQVLGSPIHLQWVLVILIKYIITAYENLELSDFNIHEDKSRKIRLLVENIEQKWIDIQITDNFDMLSQGNESRFRALYSKAEISAVNTGLDLAMVKIVVSTLGGDLRIIEKPSGGILFSVRLPIDQKEEQVELLNMIELLHNEYND